MINPNTGVSGKLSQVFFEEMVNHIHRSDSGSPFGGGHGEAQFKSLLNREYAANLAASVDLKLKVDER
ncbi:MAG: rod-binding protein [Paracoccus sp. (in: a-proteobacteria)]|nr:rod-binding protein [Paracoccus sp. (in: a-proteobacteria)]